MSVNVPVSIVMAVYNGEKFLSEAIESILNQSFNNFEFIIINDGSSDESAAIIKSFKDKRIILFEQMNKGLACALNFGIGKAAGKYIARMDADDISYQERLIKQYEFLESNPDYVLVGTNARVITEEGSFVYESENETDWEDIKKLLPSLPLFHSSVMYRKEAVVKAGLYNEKISKLGVFEDLLLWNKMIKYGKVGNIKEALISYRLAPSASTAKIGELGKVTKKLFQSALINQGLSEEEIAEYNRVKEKYKNDDRDFVYNKYLAKKYLFEGMNPIKAREHINKAAQFGKRDPELNLYYILSYLPSAIRKKVFNFIRSIKNGLNE